MDDKIFEGFRKPEKPDKNFYHVPNEWTDITAGINNLPELKVIEYIMRHTWGFKEYETLKCIATEEFVHGRKRKDGTRIDRGTGLSTTGVKEGISRAVEHGYVVCEVDDSDKGRIKKYYGLKMLPVPVLDSRDTTIDGRDETMHGLETTTDSLVETTHGRDETIRVASDGYRSEKETPERNLQKNTTERKNGAATANSTPEGSHSSTQSSPLVEFAEEEERVYELAKKLKLSFLKKNEKNKAHCAKLLSEGVTTLEQMESLIQFCRQRPYLVGKDLNLGNLAGELDSWLQVQQSQVQGRVLSSYDDPDYVDDTFYVTRVTDEELAEDVRDKVHAFREDDRFDLYLQEIKQIKAQFGLSNFDLCNLMANTCRKVTPANSGMDDFIHEMQRLMY